MFRKTSYTVGIAAYNEEKNIGNLLASIFKQKVSGGFLSEILIYSDGSTDKTVAIAKNYKDSRIKVVNGKQRMGQWYRMNQIMHEARGTIIVFLDADVVLATLYSLEYLLKGFTKGADVGLVGGNPSPYSNGTFLETAVAATVEAYEELKDCVRGGNNIFGVSGNILAIRRDIAKNITIASSVYATDAFLFFSVLKQGHKFIYVKEAKVWNRAPSTIRDQIVQNKRFSASPYHLRQFFGDIVTKEYSIPLLLYLKVIMKQFMKKPVHSITIFIINLYCKYLAKSQNKSISSTWQISDTTKGGVYYEK